MRTLFLGFTLCWLNFSTVLAADNKEKPTPNYTEQVAPILRKYCLNCHNGPVSEGGFSLATYAELLRGGERGPSLVAGKSAESLLIKIIRGEAKPKMPPKDADPLPPEAVTVLANWIDAGAKGPAGVEPGLKLLNVPKLSPAALEKQPVTALAWSPTEDVLAYAKFGEIEILKAPGPLQVRTQTIKLASKVNSLRYSKDGRWLVVASGVPGLYGEARVYEWDRGTFLLRHSIEGHRDTLYSAVLSPDRKLLATAGYDKQVILWELATGKEVRMLKGHNQAIYDLAFSPDGTVLASASGDQTVKLWQVSTGVRLDTLNQPLKEQYTVAFSPSGDTIAAAGADNRIRLWKFISRTQEQINPLLLARYAHEGAIVQIAFSRDGKTLVSAAEDRTLKLWDAQTLTELKLYDKQSDIVSTLGYDRSGKQLAVGRLDGTVQVFQLPEYQAPKEEIQVQKGPPLKTGIARPLESTQEQVSANDNPTQAQLLHLPAQVQGTIHSGSERKSDVDYYRFTAKAGERWLIEIDAARSKSPLDSKIEVLDAQGKPIERVLLQAIRDSYFTFRGKDSDTSDDFRVHNWQEMDLNEYLYSQGEITKLWLWPRGPDSGFKVYPGSGKRHTFFDTTPVAHALGEPCYIVKPYPPGTKLIPNGLPVIPLYYENDDAGNRKLGSDSQLHFTAPVDGDYLVKVTDVRGFAGPDYKYTLHIRMPVPNFKVSLTPAALTIPAGSGQEFVVKADRADGYDGPIEIRLENLPAGFTASTPIVIEAGQESTTGTINATADAKAPTADQLKQIKVSAQGQVEGKLVVHPVAGLSDLKLGPKPKVLVSLHSAQPQVSDTALSLTIAPGETITAKVRVERNGYAGRVEFGSAPGSSLAHGVIVDNIGLNGLLVPEGQTERVFFITAAKWVPDSTRYFYLKTNNEGGQTTLPILLHVRKKGGQ